ncbi:hypothetical protein K1X12_08125 [Hyphomonas sp. WL0036]|uniref:hypothetical protein n=1 Tax=Hyphomonas sediminis TaxID=2866160 RepID=UPI001C7FE775|nr:hypothetical protein [Hyphomonas sediminis]MBY9066864.1 hypothetical protein [Hyphomonas sediminis]
MAGIGKAVARVMTALGIGAIAAAGAAGAQPKTFEPTPDCMIAADYVAPRFSHSVPGMLWRDGDFTIEGAILSWYLGGPQAIFEADDFNLVLWDDCFDPKSKVTCPGIRKDKAIAKAFNRPYGKLTKGDRKAIEAYFSAPPPDAAIRFAAQGIGRCFGSHPAQGTMEELGLRRGPFEGALCGAAIMNAPDLPGAPTFSGWDYAQDEHNANRAYGEGGRCTFIPEYAIAAAEARMAELTADTAARESRTVEQRIAGLNGCQIAYGLVSMGLGGQRGGVSRVPDEGIDWALKYEQSVIDNEVCPIMPKPLSDWVQAQPLEKFEAAEDPFTGFMRRKPGTSTYADWAYYIGRVAAHYETPETPQVDLSGDLCPDFHTWLAQKHYSGAGGSDALSKFLQNNAATLDLSLRPAVCVAVPKWMYANYVNERAVQNARRAAFDAKMAQREAFMKSLEEIAKVPYKPAYRPPAGEPRCYRTGEKTETCFYN